PLLGRSSTDVVVQEEPSSAPDLVFELKWCQRRNAKIYEAIWDLFKVALLVEQYGAVGYLVTAAPTDMWEAALCADLLGPGTWSATDLLTRTFPNGRPIWDWLLEGGNDRYPDEVPTQISTFAAGNALVRFGDLIWELRAARVEPSSTRLLLADGWAEVARP